MSADVDRNPPVVAAAKRPVGLRFTLRGLLIAVTLLCVGLAWRLHRAQEQREAVQGIRDAGGWVYYDYQRFDPRTGNIDPNAQPWEPQWLTDLVGIDFFHDVLQVNMSYDENGPQRLDNESRDVRIGRHLAHFPRLNFLALNQGNLDDEGSRQIAGLQRLETILYWEAQLITDEGARHLAKLARLRHLHLGDSQITDEGLAELAKLPNLEGLTMQKNRLTDEAAASLAGHPRLTDLWVGGLAERAGQITDAGVAELAQIPNLEELDLQYTPVTVEGLKPLQKCTKLKALYLSGSKADDYEAVAPLFPNCKVDAQKKNSQSR